MGRCDYRFCGRGDGEKKNYRVRDLAVTATAHATTCLLLVLFSLRTQRQPRRQWVNVGSMVRDVDDLLNRGPNSLDFVAHMHCHGPAEKNYDGQCANGKCLESRECQPKT